MSNHTLVLPGLSPVESLDIHARFDGGALSSDGGVLLLYKIKGELGMCAMLAGCMSDPRDPAHQPCPRGNDPRPHARHGLRLRKRERHG